MSNNQPSYIHADAMLGFAVFLLWGAGIVGYLFNLWKLYHQCCAVFSGEIVLRIIGVVLGPIGAIMGYV